MNSRSQRRLEKDTVSIYDPEWDFYLITIHAKQKKADVTSFHIQDVISFLSDNGVRFHSNVPDTPCYPNVYSDHGLYRQLHFHGIARYQGRYKHLTSMAWAAGPDDDTGIDFKIHWKKITKSFPFSCAIIYILSNRKLQDRVLTEELLKEYDEYPLLWG